MGAASQDSMEQYLDFGGISLPEIEGSHQALANDQTPVGELLPDLSNAPTPYIGNCSVHPFEACVMPPILNRHPLTRI